MRRFISFLLSAESLLRSRRRWVLAVMTICVCLAVCDGAVGVMLR